MDNRDLHCSHEAMINRDDECHKAPSPIRGLRVMEGYVLIHVSGYMDFTVTTVKHVVRSNGFFGGQRVEEKTNRITE